MLTNYILLIFFNYISLTEFLFLSSFLYWYNVSVNDNYWIKLFKLNDVN